MRQWDEVYPQYGFAKHKGYGTASHIQAIKKNTEFVHFIG